MPTIATTDSKGLCCLVIKNCTSVVLHSALISGGLRLQILGGLARGVYEMWGGGLINASQEAQLPLRNRASAMYFFVAKLLSALYCQKLESLSCMMAAIV